MRILHPVDVVLLGRRSGSVSSYVISSSCHSTSAWCHENQVNCRILSHRHKYVICDKFDAFVSCGRVSSSQKDRSENANICRCETTMLLAGFMMITSFISLWISDTACAALMAPIAYALLEAIMVHKMRPVCMNGNEIAMQDHGEHSKHKSSELDVSRLSKRDQGFCKCLMLIVAHASLIGGTGTINSTGPNLIFRDTLEKFYPGENTGISYLSWMGFAIPPMIGYMFSSWIVVQIQFLGVRQVLRMFKTSTEEEAVDEQYIHKAVHAAYNDLGPMTFAEKSTLTIFLLTVASWITSDPKVFNGWATFFKRGYVTDTCSGMLAVFVLFVWPREMPDFSLFRPKSERGRPPVRREALLTWDAVKRRFPWSVILLLGAGFAISKSVKESGLSSLIACNMEHLLSGFPLTVMQVVISVITVTLTEFSTNSATASIIIPIAFNIAESVRAHPLYFSIPAAIGPSFSFMLPMATPPNAIVYESGTMRMIDMVSCGIFLNILCIAITALNMNTWAHWLFSMGTYPDYVYNHNNTSPCHV
uniref:Na+/dicarboxylate na+/tricarboxylate and phosphate transporter n=1 Tax=Haemonchus contortus TaxID=6289 RepID=A0A7I4Y994_HAECO